MAEEAKADTSVENKEQITPAPQTDTSAQTNQGTGDNTSTDKKEEVKPETVTLTKEELAEKERLIAVGQGAQKELGRYQRVFGKIGDKGGHFKPAAKAATEDGAATPPAEDQGAIEDRKAERMLLGIAADPEYRAVLDADPTLRDLFARNPLGVLPLLAPDALDAEDAKELVKEKLDARLEAIKKASTENPAPVATTEKKDEAPNAGGVNTSPANQDAEYESARKVDNTEQAIAGMVKVKMKRG